MTPVRGCPDEVSLPETQSAAGVNLLRGRVADCVRQGPVVVLRLAMEKAPQVFLEAYWHDNRPTQPARGDWIELQVHAQQIHSWPSSGERGITKQQIFGPTGIGIVRADVPKFLDDARVLRYIAVGMAEFDAIWARAERVEGDRTSNR